MGPGRAWACRRGIVATNETNQTNHSQWLQTSAGLHMRADATDAGRLVRLADVVLWLIESEGMPRIPAVRRLADELEAARFEPALFLVQAGDYAKQAEGAAAAFGYRTFQSWAAEAIAQEIFADMRRDPWRFNLESGLSLRLPDSKAIARVAEARAAQGELPRNPQHPADLVNAGVPALLRLLRTCWTWGRWPGVTSDAEAFTHRRLPGRAVAVRLTDAARIWGYGADWLPDAGAVSGTKVATLDDLRAALKSHPTSKPWPDEWVVLLRAEFSVRGGWVRRADGSRGPNSKVAEQLGKDIDRTRQALMRYLKEPPSAGEMAFEQLTAQAAGRR